MSVKISGQVWELDLDPMDKLVLLALADHADHEGNNIRPGNDLLCAKTGVSHQTISAKLKKFTEIGLIKPSGSIFGRGKKREFSIEPEAAERHAYFVEKEKKKLQARRTFQTEESCKQSASLESERCKLTDQKVQADSGKVQTDDFSHDKERARDESSIEPSIEPSIILPASPLQSVPSSKSIDPIYAIFAESFCQRRGMPYLSKKADFIQLAALRKQCATASWELTIERFSRATQNYFESELGSYTLAHLCTAFSTFYRSSLDRFGKPAQKGNSYAKTSNTPTDHAAIVATFKPANRIGG